MKRIAYEELEECDKRMVDSLKKDEEYSKTKKGKKMAKGFRELFNGLRSKFPKNKGSGVIKFIRYADEEKHDNIGSPKEKEDS